MTQGPLPQGSVSPGEPPSHGSGTPPGLRRLHPLSPVLRGFRLLAVVVAIVSIRGIEQLGFQQWLMTMFLVLVGVLAYSAISWQFTGYEIVGRELRIHEGVISRRVRAVPLERLQAVEVAQPLISRIFGLAEVRLDVAGAGERNAEAPLAFLTLADAHALRTYLLTATSPEHDWEIGGSLGGSLGVPSKLHADTRSATEFHRVRNSDVVLSQILTPPVMFTPVAIIYIVGQLLFNQDFGLFTVASMVIALFGTIGAPLMRVQAYWNFRLSRTPEGNLHIEHGLADTRSQTIPPRRVQSLTLTWPFLWRGQGWLHMTLAVAGQSGSDEQRRVTNRLLPVADWLAALRVARVAVPGIDVAGVPLTPVPERAHWVAPVRYQVLSAGFSEHAFAVVDGVLARRLTVVPYERIQSVRVTQGPLQRRLGLASVHIDIAGSIPVTAQHRLLVEAYAWADELTRRARTARERRPSPPQFQ